jgi:hypothetical protein
MKLKMRHLNLFLIALVISFLSACYPYDSVYTDELDATITVYDTLTDFSKFKTYVIRDSVGLVYNDWLTDAQVNEFYSQGGSSDKIEAMVKAKFDALGYTEVTDLADADFAINMTMFAIEYSTYYYYYPGWWWGYPGYWPPYWGPYKKSVADVNYYYPWYPYYPSYTYYTSYEGLLLVEMADAKTITDNDPEIRFIWEAGIQGSLTSDKSYNQERIQRGLDEAFEQSPYLGFN